MNTAIIQQMNIIRTLEQKKLLGQLERLLKSAKKPGKIKLPPELVKNLTLLHEEYYTENNAETALANYKKLRNTLLLLIRKHRKISQEIKKVEENLASADVTQSAAIPNSPGLFLPALKESVNSIINELDEINQKFKSYIPEQFDLKPLAPFYFINRDIHFTGGRVSVIVQIDDEGDHLKDLFDSFLKYNTYTDYNFMVISPESSARSQEIIKSYQDRIRLDIISYEQKLTVSYLYNLAVDASRSELLLFLNSRVILNNDILTRFISLFKKDASSGMMGAAITTPENMQINAEKELTGTVKFTFEEMSELPDIIFPFIDPGYLVKSGIKLSVRDHRHRQRVFIPGETTFNFIKPVNVTHNRGAGVEPVPALSGSAFLCRRSDLILAGGFDLNYMNDLEVTDLCLKFARRLSKKTCLAHEIQVTLSPATIKTEPGPEDEITRNYNLGVLLNSCGYYIKYKYFNDLINNKHFWTSETKENVKNYKRFFLSLDPKLKKDVTESEEILTDKILTTYLNGIRDKKLRIAIKIAAFDDENAVLWGDYHFAHSLKKAFIRKGYPARVDLYDSWYKRGYLTDDVVIVLRGIKNYHTRGSQINIIWNISHSEQMNLLEYQDYDHVFVASSVFAGELWEKWGVEAENLLQCTDHLLFKPETTDIKDEEKTDILFVGNSRGVLRKSIKYAMEKKIPVALYGSKWENLMPTGMIKGNYIKNEELRKYYSNCEILLNDHWEDMAATGYISNRIFDALACGAIVLTDRVKGMEQVFPDGLFYYSSADELAERIKWIREHMQEAKQMALKNSKMVLENHTFDIRAERILEVALQIHHQKTTIAQPEVMKRPNVWHRWFDFNRINPLK